MSIQEKSFGKMPDGTDIKAYAIKNGNSIEAEIVTLGCAINRLRVPDRNGYMSDIVLGCDTPIDLWESPCFGAAIGRFGNRIKHGRFILDGVEYQLNQNNNGNHLHGGNVGFHHRIWQTLPYDADGNSISFSYISPDGEEKYPGTLKVTIMYSLGVDHIEIRYTAQTDKATILNLTNHSYFNLAGHASGSIENHEIRIAASQYSEADDNLILTGVNLPVEGTGCDFRKFASIRHGMDMGCVLNTKQMLSPSCKGGYDTNFPLDKGSEYALAAEAYDPSSGRTMQVLTDQPCLQFYTGNFMDAIKGKDDVIYGFRGGLCLETQKYPDSPRFPQWPSCVLRPGEVYESKTTYRFSTR